MLFLTDVDHVSFEKANETRQNNPPIGYRVPASRHRFVQTQRNGGSENQSRRFKWACQIVCSTTAFFLLPSSGRVLFNI